MRPFNESGKYARHEFFKQCKRLQLFRPYLGPDIIPPKASDHQGQPKALAGTGGFKLKGKHK